MSVITKLPLSRLSTSRGDARGVGDVGGDAIRDLLRAGPVRFVVADIGASLHWVLDAERFDFWKKEVQPHLAEPDARVDLEQFPSGYLYFASQWDDGSTPIIVLSRSH